MKLYPFIEAEQDEQPAVAPACRLLEISRSAYYQWAAHTPSERERSHASLTESIKGIHRDSWGTYGAPRVHAATIGAGAP
jgi:putative transposase